MKLKKIYLIGFLIILTLPLLSLPHLFTPPDWGKTIVFRIVLSILIFIFLWQYTFNKNKDPEITKKLNFLKSKRNLIFWFLFSFIALNLLATIFSLEPVFSLWGSPYRSGGFINLLFYFIFAILAFLILEKKDWEILLNFSIIIGILVSFIALIQWQGLLPNIFISKTYRPSSTLGNPIMLAIYLSLLTFLTLSFLLKSKKIIIKILYTLAFGILISTIIISLSRAVYLGLFLGLTYFIFFFPYKKRAASIILKTSLSIFIILLILGIYYVNTQTNLPDFVQNNKALKQITSRLSIATALKDSRISSYKISWQALKDRPLFGYGPENFSIAFDKYYNPSLKDITKLPGADKDWWDRGHNFVFDIALTAGIPALIVFLGLFVVWFLQLKQIKPIYPEIAQGIQATLIAYLFANFFSFDTFSIYLILFLLISYTLYAIFTSKTTESSSSTGRKYNKSNLNNLYKVILSFFLIFFLWFFNIKPLIINRQINLALALADKKHFTPALEKMEEILPQKSFLDNYAHLKYVEIINQALAKDKEIKTQGLMEKAINSLEAMTKTRPYYTRTWTLLGAYYRDLIKDYQVNKLKEAEYAFEKAYYLSPKRIGTVIELNQIYIQTKNYTGLAETYPKVIETRTNNPQDYASLAFIYKELGEIEKAKETALKIIELFPEHEEEAKAFLSTLE